MFGYTRSVRNNVRPGPHARRPRSRLCLLVVAQLPNAQAVRGRRASARASARADAVGAVAIRFRPSSWLHRASCRGIRRILLVYDVPLLSIPNSPYSNNEFMGAAFNVLRTVLVFYPHFHPAGIGALPCVGQSLHGRSHHCAGACCRIRQERPKSAVIVNSSPWRSHEFIANYHSGSHVNSGHKDVHVKP